MKKSAGDFGKQWLKRVGFTLRKQSNYVCPYCQKQAGFYCSSRRPLELGVDPLLNKIGCCINPECLNGPLYPRDLADKKTWKKIEARLEKITGFKYGVLVCPKCKQWTLWVLNHSAQEGLAAKCNNARCDREFLLQLT